MKKTTALAAFVGISLAVGTALAITENQAIVMPVLQSLKFEPIPSKVLGGPQKFKITKATIEHLQKALDDGSVIIVQNNGSIKIEKE